MWVVKLLLLMTSGVLIISAKDFDCNVRKVYFERRNETLLTCELIKVRYDEKQDFVLKTNHSVIEKVMNISKIDSDDYDDEDVVDLDDLVVQIKFKSSKLPVISNQIFKKLQKLKIFDGSGIGLRYLNSLSFNGAGSLEMIFLQNNQLSSLNAYCFVHSKNLTLLDLSKNKITNIQGFAFAALSQLETLTLSNNNIKIIEDSTFNPLTSLKWIGLDNNQMTIVSSDLFVGMKESLKGIYLNNNNIEMISPYTFDLLQKLRFLTLSANRCINLDFLNHVIQENSAIKFELRRCHKEYRKVEFFEDDKYSIKLSVEKMEDASKVCFYESMKIITELFDVQDQLSRL